MWLFFRAKHIQGCARRWELLIGEFREGGELYFMKDRIAGLNPFSRMPIYDAIQDLKIRKCPFANVPRRLASASTQRERCNATMHLAEAGRSAEIEFIERTSHRRLFAGPVPCFRATKSLCAKLYILLGSVRFSPTACSMGCVPHDTLLLR